MDNIEALVREIRGRDTLSVNTVALIVKWSRFIIIGVEENCAMTVEWFDKSPGGMPCRETCSGTEVLVKGEPDWVKLPKVLGGLSVKVLSISSGECPCCASEARLYMLDHMHMGKRMYASECTNKKEFVWHTRGV